MPTDSESDLVTIDDPIRRRYVEAARSVLDLRGDSQAYLDFVAPGETSQRQRDMARMSGCALTVAGIWRAAGVVSPLLDPPYADGSAVSRLYVIARRAGAWCPWNSTLEPDLGDMVLIGNNTNAGGVEHVYTIVGWQDGAQKIFDTVDGGQVDISTGQKLQCILAKSHQWHGQRDGSRIIMGVVDCTKLPIPDPPDQAA